MHLFHDWGIWLPADLERQGERYVPTKNKRKCLHKGCDAKQVVALPKGARS